MRKKIHGNAASVYVFNESGDLIYPYDVAAGDANDISKYYKLTDSDQDTLTIQSPVTDQKEYVSRLNSAYTGYTYLTIQPKSVILAPVYKMLKILLAVVAAFLFCSSDRFLQAFPFCSKTSETPEAHYPAYGTGHSRSGKSHFLSSSRQ